MKPETPGLTLILSKMKEKEDEESESPDTGEGMEGKAMAMKSFMDAVKSGSAEKAVEAMDNYMSLCDE